MLQMYLLTILFIILLGVLRAKGIDECDFETTASEWFRLSKLRYGRENKKILPDDEPDAHNTKT